MEVWSLGCGFSGGGEGLSWSGNWVFWCFFVFNWWFFVGYWSWGGSRVGRRFGVLVRIGLRLGLWWESRR